MRQKQATQGEVRGGPLAFGHERVGGLLNPVMQEPVGLLFPQHQPGPHRSPKYRVHRFFTFAPDHGQGANRRAVAETGQHAHGRLCRGGQAPQLAQHEIRDVVGIAFGPYSLEVPIPARLRTIEPKQTFVRQRAEELKGEERIARGVLVHQPRKRQHTIGPAVQSVGEHPAHIFEPERCQRDFVHSPAGLPDRSQPTDQWVRRRDLVVAICANQQQMTHIRLRAQVLEQVERGGVQPLEVVQEQRQRMLRSGKDSEQAPDDQMEAALRVLWRQLRDQRLWADEQFELRDERCHQPPARAQSFSQARAPRREFGFALAQQRSHKALQRLRQARIGNVALVLVEFARCKQSARRHERAVEFVHDRRFAGPGRARNQHQLRPAGGNNPVEGGKQDGDLALPTV